MTAQNVSGLLHRAARCSLVVLLAAATLAIAAVGNGSAPAAGDTYVYRMINAYNNEPRGQVSYRVDRAEVDRIVMSVTTEQQGAALTAEEIYTADGKWLRHPLISRDRPITYDFAQPCPSYEFPLERGKSWSHRVEATNPATGRRQSVRIDAEVGGSERVRVPAGEFDAVKITRTIYTGDADFPKRETTITETEWYAPALGRSVKLVSNSFYVDNSLPIRSQLVRGDWNIFELVSAPATR